MTRVCTSTFRRRGYTVLAKLSNNVVFLFAGKRVYSDRMYTNDGIRRGAKNVSRNSIYPLERRGNGGKTRLSKTIFSAYRFTFKRHLRRERRRTRYAG